MINQQRSEGQAVGRGTMRGWGRRADVEKESESGSNEKQGREKLGGGREVKGRNEEGWSDI